MATPAPRRTRPRARRPLTSELQLEETRWDLFAAVAKIQDHRKPDADTLIRDVGSWLKVDEHALAGGLANKLSEAVGRAIKLFTPTQELEPEPKLPKIDQSKPKPGWKQVNSGGKARMSNTESISETKSILESLEQNRKLRLTVQWTLEEESP